MPRDDEWGEDWVREDEEWHDPREDEPTRVGDEYEDEPYDEPDDGPYDAPDGEPYDADGGYEDEPDPRRRGLLVAMLAILVLVVGVALAALLVRSGDDSDSDVTADRSSTTTSLRTTLTSLGQLPGAATSSSTSTSVDPDGPATGGGLGSSTTATTKKPATTTTTTDVDVTNDPDCVEGVTGTSLADNQPMRVSFCVDDQAPKVGQEIKVIGTAVDKDAQIEPECIKVSWEGEGLGSCPDLRVAGPDLVINRDFTFTHAFTKPGTYTIHVAASSDQPKSSLADATYKITVHA